MGAAAASSVSEQCGASEGAGGEGMIGNNGGGVFVAHRSTAWAAVRAVGPEQRVRHGSGQFGGEHPPRVAVFEVGSLVGEHDPAFGRVEGTQEAGGDHDPAPALRGGEGVEIIGVTHDQRAGTGQVLTVALHGEQGPTALD